MYFITIKRMLEVCFSAHPNIQYRAPYLLRHYTSNMKKYREMGNTSVNTGEAKENSFIS